MTEKRMIQPRMSSVARRDFLQYLGVAGVLVSSSGLMGGCGQSLLATDISFPQTTTPPVLGGDAAVPWWLRGNYAPVTDEQEVFDLEVMGTIPPEINGHFLRNGPNPKSGTSDFWLRGDGMLHGVEFSNGKALSYRNRWVRTSVWESGEAALLSNPSNTALLHHGGKLLALYEMGAPYVIDLPSLGTEGIYHFQENALSGPMTAHPKVDPNTGEMFFIGYFPVAPYLRFHTVNPAGELVRTEEIDIPRGVMMHDFQLTTNYAIFFDLPMIFNFEGSSTFPVEFAPQHGSRMGVMPRAGTSADVKWFDIDPCYIFHTMNAYEDASGRVVIEGCRIDSFWENGFDSEAELPTASPWQWTLDPQTGAVSEGRIIDTFMDFPMIDLRLQGVEHRMNYGLRLVPGTSDYPMHPEGVVKHDRMTGVVDGWDSGPGIQPDEALFVPDPSDTAEDAGWLLTMVYNRADNISEVVILDATDVAGGPIARVKMPRRVPFGFHGHWVPASV